MEFKKLGSSQVPVSVIGLGTGLYSGGIEPLRAALDHGACIIDTAEIYGSEEVVGQAIQGVRKDVFLATRAAPRNFRRRDLIAAAENSLRRLSPIILIFTSFTGPIIRFQSKKPWAPWRNW